MFGIPHFIIFGVHLMALCVAVCGMLLADSIGLSWFRSAIHTLPVKRVHMLHEVMSGALAFLIASGLMLFWPERDYLVTQPLFFLKMAFIGVLIINSFVIDSLMHHATRTSYRSLPLGTKRALIVSGAVSSICWAGAALAALALFGL